MNQDEYGASNPRAPSELSHFAFLIGRWNGEGVSRYEFGNDTGSPYRMSWVGRYILDGYAIADEARILAEDGTAENIFITYRFYDSNAKRWIIEGFNVLESTIMKQASEPGGVQVSDGAITLTTHGPTVVSRELFLIESHDHFTFRQDLSTDEGKTWKQGVDSIEVERVLD